MVNRQLHVMMLGLRGFPNVQGGVETHAENLCPLLVEQGCQISVITRSLYHAVETDLRWRGVDFIPLWHPKSKSMEAIVHTFLGVLYAAIKRPDILHIQAIGPSIMTPLARLLGLRVIVTHHGPDYERQKWGRFARRILHLGERWGMRYANGRIVISQVIADLVLSKHRVSSTLIPNGVVMPQIPNSINTLTQFKLTSGRYVLLVSRLVPEKRHLDLIAAFKLANLPDWKLVLIGGADHPDTYQREVIAKAAEIGAIMTGVQQGTALWELFTHAGLFVLPSSHEGLPIVLLEALSFGLPVLASDIPANLEVGLADKHYFPLGNIERLADKIRQWSTQPLNKTERKTIRTWVTERYNWHDIAKKTQALYIKTAL
ncbi:glycosyltransferase family 4 protein [Crenothrix polyspora]|uniref:Glycosyl transferase group 1 n=1 Tax=Crenothrix polyspora TaxID=360316 RepID=A0A1R4HEB1_9GAMM